MISRENKMLHISKKKKVRVRHHVCPTHQKHPGCNYAGCTCRSEYTAEDIGFFDRYKEPFEIEGFLEPPLKNPTAHRIGYVCDQGHYGSITCSHCGTDVEDEFNICPGCKRKLTLTAWGP